MNTEHERQSFEENYLYVREKESRIYADEMVSTLPDVPESDPHFNEWVIRKRSFEQLKKYLQKKNKALRILDLGCGNGWMSNKLTEINDATVTGVDVNYFEIEQAKRVFKFNTRLTFNSADVLAGNGIKMNSMDVIIMAASIQYFPSLDELIKKLFELLNAGGEIHILDSPFYSEENKYKAKEASRHYYSDLGCEAMAAYYHHHTWSELSGFRFNIVNRSIIDLALLKLLQTKRNYFPWVIIYKS